MHKNLYQEANDELEGIRQELKTAKSALWLIVGEDGCSSRHAVEQAAIATGLDPYRVQQAFFKLLNDGELILDGEYNLQQRS